MADISFGACIGAVDFPGADDEAMYRGVTEDVDVISRLGYAGVWALEHHFSNYYPTPSPLMILANVAGRHPHLELGSMVLVAPWYQPVRLAEDIAMLSLMTQGGVHLGLGRGSAAMEYEAFGMDLDESRDRFQECMEIVQLALLGEPFSYQGRFTSVKNQVVLRPAPRRDRITLYGAISTAPSAKIMADLNMPVFCNAFRPLDLHRQVLDDWTATMTAAGRPTAHLPRLIQGHVIVADTDEEAFAQARQYLPAFFQAQLDHYRTDAATEDATKSYNIRRMQGERERLTHPENIDGFAALQFIGSPETVRRRVQDYRDLGFDKFVVTTNTPGIPQKLRHHWLTRFAQDVAPDFSAAFRQKKVA